MHFHKKILRQTKQKISFTTKAASLWNLFFQSSLILAKILNIYKNFGSELMIFNLGCPNFYSLGLLVFCCALQNLVVLYTLGDFGLSGESENRLQDCFSDTYPFPLSDCWIIHNVPALFFKVPASFLSIQVF